MLALVVAILLQAVLVSSAPVPLSSLNETAHPKAKCLDGTTAGYYHQKASKTQDETKWMIYLFGGGECDQKEACQEKLLTPLGSSKYFKPTLDSNGWYIGSDVCKYNPTFCTWNHVADPYCSQDLHMGQVETPSNDTWGLYFAGHHILEAILTDLDTSANLTQATEIILYGASAGGIGTWPHLDYLAERYPRAKVTGMTIAGFYFYATHYTGPNATTDGLSDFTQPAWPRTFALYDAFVDADCAHAGSEKGSTFVAADCMLANVSYPYVTTPTFMIQSQTDKVVLTCHDSWPAAYMQESEERAFMHEWHVNMTSALTAATTAPQQAKNGVFSVACYTHTTFEHNGPLLEKLNYQQAFDKFYKGERVVLMDDCGEMCNPTCK